MDTREKILTPIEAQERLKGRPACWVSGNFDPLLAEHVRKLQASKTSDSLLVVEVTNPPQALLTQRARAELVAALGMVDYAVLSDRPPSNEPEDSAITERFIEHVLSRHRKEVGQ